MNNMDFPDHWRVARFGDITVFTKKPKDLRYSEYDEIPFIPMELIPIAKLFSEEFVTNDMRVRTGPKGSYFYPDVVVFCAPPI